MNLVLVHLQRLVRILLVMLVGLVAVCLLALLATRQLVNDQLRATIAQTATDASGLAIEIGAVRGTWWAGLTLQDVVVHETDSPTSGMLLRAPEVRVSYSLLSMLSKKPRPIRVTAYRPSVSATVGMDHVIRIRPKSRPADPDAAPPPPVDISVQDGQVAYTDLGAREPFRAEMDALGGTGTLRGYDLDLKLTLRRDAVPLAAQVHYDLQHSRGRVQAQAQGLSAPYFVNRFGYAPEYHMNAGKADLDVAVSWQDPLDPKMSSLKLEGSVRLREGAIQVLNVDRPIEHLQADIRLSGQQAELLSATGELVGMPIRARGTVSRLIEPQPRYKMPDPVLRLDLDAPEVALERLGRPFPGMKDLGLEGQGELHARVSGTSMNPRVDMQAVVPAGRYQREPIADFRIAATYRPGSLDVPHWQGALAGGLASGSARVGLPADPKSPVPYQVSGHFQGLELAPLIARYSDKPPAIGLDGKLAVNLQLEGLGERVDTRLDAAVTNGHLANQPLHRLNARFHYRTPRWELPELAMRWGDAALTAQASGGDQGDFKATLNMAEADLAQLLRLAPQPPAVPLAGRLTGEASLEGLLAQPATWQGRGRAALAKGLVDGERLPEAHMRFSLKDNHLHVEDGQARALGGHLAYQGQAGPLFDAAPDQLAAKFDVTARGLELTEFRRLPPELHGVEARAEGRFNVSLQGPTWRVDGQANARRLRHPVWGHLDALSATFSADAHALRLAPLTWHQGQEQVHTAGTVWLGAKPRLDLHVTTRQAQIATLLDAVNWPQVEQALNPRAVYSGAATGPERPRAELPGHEAYSPTQPLRLRPLLEHWLVWRKEPLDRPKPAAALLPFWEGTRGKLSLEAHVVGPAEQPTVTLEAQAEALDLFERHLDEADMALTWSKTRVAVSRLRLREAGRTVLTGGGAFSDRPRDQLVLRAHALDLAWSRRALAPYKMRLEGHGDVLLNLRGPWRAPRMAATAELSNGRFEGPGMEPFAYERVQANMAYERGILAISQASLRQDGKEATVSGTIPVDEDNQGSGAPIDLAVRLEDGNLGIINLFSQGQFQWLGGKGFAELRLGGTMPHPTLAGQVQLREGRFTAKGLETPVENVSADVTVNSDKVMVKSIEARYGGGDVNVFGEVFLNEFKPERFNLTALAKPFRLQLSNDYYQGLVEANMRLSGPVAQPVLSGMLSLRDGVIRLKDDTKKESATAQEPNPLRLSGLQIALGPNLRLKNALIDVGLTTQQRQGFLQVDGSLAAPTPYGVVIIDGGTIRPLNNTFNILEGRVEFQGEQVRTEDELSAILAPDDKGDPGANLNAKLDIRANTTVYDYQQSEPIAVTAAVSGTLQQMEMRFTSEPIRSEQEILDILSKKQVLSQTFSGRLDGGQVIVKEVGGLVSSNLEEFISPYTLYLRNALHLQTFRVELVPDYTKADANSGLTAGFRTALAVETRPLWDRLSLSSQLVMGEVYSTSLTTAGVHTNMGMNWRINRYLSMQYRIDPYVDSANQRLLNQTLGIKAQFNF